MCEVDDTNDNEEAEEDVSIREMRTLAGLETQMRFKFNPRYVFFSLCFLTLLIMLHCSFTNDFTLLLLYATVATTRNSMGTGTHYYRRRPQVRFFISFYIFFDYTNDVHLLVYYAVTVVPNSRDEEKQLGWSFKPRTLQEKGIARDATREVVRFFFLIFFFPYTNAHLPTVTVTVTAGVVPNNCNVDVRGPSATHHTLALREKCRGLRSVCISSPRYIFFLCFFLSIY